MRCSSGSDCSGSVAEIQHGLFFKMQRTGTISYLYFSYLQNNFNHKNIRRQHSLTFVLTFVRLKKVGLL
jgi:hypothetical protein